MPRIRDQLKQFRDGSKASRTRLCQQIKSSLQNKLELIERNWPSTCLRDLYLIVASLNVGYLEQILDSDEINLMQRSHLVIAIKRSDGTADLKLIDKQGVRCRGMKGNGKILVENPYENKRKFQVWSGWTENNNQITKHLGKPTNHASVWNSEISREERIMIEKAAILEGKGKYFSKDRIDFVFENDADVGLLKRSSARTRFVYVELTRQPSMKKAKKHLSLFHGFPISEQKFQSF